MNALFHILFVLNAFLMGYHLFSQNWLYMLISALGCLICAAYVFGAQSTRR